MNGLPNIVTQIRLFLTPVAVVLYLINPKKYWLHALIVFVLVAATDKLDGHLAKRIYKSTGKNKVTVLGSFLDTLVDKIFIVATLVALSIVRPIIWVPTVIIAAREIYVFLFLRRAKYRGQDIAVVPSGRVKMTVQCIAIAFLFPPFTGAMLGLVWIIVFAAVVLTITSWIDYLKAFRDAK